MRTNCFSTVIVAAAAAVICSGEVLGEAGPSEPSARWEQHEIARGWKIKCFEPRASLDDDFLEEATQADETSGWLAAAKMPAMVHDILLDHGEIPVPWRPGGSEACQWVADRDWAYAVRFPATQPDAESWLRFQGLDTIVDVYLNGVQIASHGNMYSPLAVNVSGRLREENSLVLHFHSIFEPSNGKRNPIRYVGGDRTRPVRRPSQNYSSYLGPNPPFSRVGVYDKVLLEVTHGSRMAEVAVRTDLDEALTGGEITLDVSGTSRLQAVELRVRALDPDGQTAAQSTVRADVRKGAFNSRIRLQVRKPQLWWPRGYGDQPLYRVETTLIANGRPHQEAVRTVGFRRITMSQPLHFVVNGVPVRLWGADWVTPHWRTAVWDPPRVARLIAMAEHAHFNAFRVWGSVESPRDEFYEMADARGFLLWQDFTQLPLGADAESRAICRAEAAQMVRRLQHHPSILVWCGGNESAMWNDPEFHSRLEDRGPWPGRAAAEEVGAVCRRLDPSRYYQPSSPYFGIDPNDPRRGDTHGYTNMWFVPGYDYLNFATEDTRIAAPPLHSLKRFMAPEDLWPADYSPVYQHGDVYPYPATWRRYTTGTSWKKTGPVELFYDAADPASAVYRLGMAEALYYQETVERQRRGRDAADPIPRRRCGGYLAWKYNDSWPQIYSGKVDYFLEPYHAYYALRRAYSPILLSFDKATYIHLWAVNDTRRPVRGTVTIRLFHLDRNEVRKEIVRAVDVGPDQSKVIVRLDQAGIGAFRKEHVLHAALKDESGRRIAEAFCLGDVERRVTFPDAKLDVTVRDGELAIRSDKFAHSVTLEGDANGDAFGWFFEDNYFDLMPGQEKRVRVLGGHSEGRVTAKAWYSPHTTQVSWRR